MKNLILTSILITSLQVLAGGGSSSGPTGISNDSSSNDGIFNCSSNQAYLHRFCLKTNNDELKCFEEKNMVKTGSQYKASSNEFSFFQMAASQLNKIKNLPNYTEEQQQANTSQHCEYQKEAMCIATENYIITLLNKNNASEVYDCQAYYKKTCLPVK